MEYVSDKYDDHEVSIFVNNSIEINEGNKGSNFNQ